jgi:phage tail-like protein
VRGPIDDLATPHPLGAALPALYQEDDLTQRMLGALDGVLAPVLSSLDNLEHYLDPALAPPDFVAWLAEWVGALVDETWPPERQRAMVARMVTLYRRRGTVGGLREQLELATGGDVEVEDNGEVSWSPSPQAALPGSDNAFLRIKVRVDDPNAVDLAELERLVVAAKPAHVPHLVEVSGR